MGTHQSMMWQTRKNRKTRKKTNEGTNEEKAADSFVNDVYTSEGKQEQFETIGEIKDQDEKKDDAPAPDTSIDDVANEKEQEHTKEDTQEGEKAADSFINDIYTSEGKQEPFDDVDE